MKYIIVRYGSNGANQSGCQRAVLGTVTVQGKTTAQRKRELVARVGSSSPGTLDATTTFRRDDGLTWEAYHNQYFRWIAAARATAEDWREAAREDALDAEYLSNTSSE